VYLVSCWLSSIVSAGTLPWQTSANLPILCRRAVKHQLILLTWRDWVSPRDKHNAYYQFLKKLLKFAGSMQAGGLGYKTSVTVFEYCFSCLRIFMIDPRWRRWTLTTLTSASTDCDVRVETLRSEELTEHHTDGNETLLYCSNARRVPYGYRYLIRFTVFVS